MVIPACTQMQVNSGGELQNQNQNVRMHNYHTIMNKVKIQEFGSGCTTKQLGHDATLVANTEENTTHG